MTVPIIANARAKPGRPWSDIVHLLHRRRDDLEGDGVMVPIESKRRVDSRGTDG
jgi:hypothetical protein